MAVSAFLPRYLPQKRVAGIEALVFLPPGQQLVAQAGYALPHRVGGVAPHPHVAVDGRGPLALELLVAPADVELPHSRHGKDVFDNLVKKQHPGRVGGEGRVIGGLDAIESIARKDRYQVRDRPAIERERVEVQHAPAFEQGAQPVVKLGVPLGPLPGSRVQGKKPVQVALDLLTARYL